MEVRPGGPQGDGVGYSECNGQAATLSRHRASSLVFYDAPCAALDVAPLTIHPNKPLALLMAIGA